MTSISQDRSVTLAASNGLRPTAGKVDRVTVALTTRVSSELERLRVMTGLSKTDLVNRALSLYHLTEKELEQGHELAFYDPEKDEFRRVHIA